LKETTALHNITLRDIVNRIKEIRSWPMATIIRTGTHTVAITQDERDFFIELGSRIAAMRKGNHLTQVQLAETLGVAQPTLNAYELGQRRVPVSALPLLAKALGVSLEELMGEPAAKSSKRGPAPKLAQYMERISQLPKPQQRFVMQVIESVLAQQGR
jgi:transcriptional regulator with XRE-family HTH domain